MKTPVETLDNAMKPIIDEMFQNGPEEGCRIWDDYNHPLHRALEILFRAQVWLKYPGSEAAWLEQHGTERDL